MTDGADRERRAGRGRLSSLELLPPEAEEDVAWARLELGKRERSQADILHDFNGKLVDKGLEPVSKSAFNRASVRLAAMNRRLADARAFYDSMGTQSPEKVDEQGAVLGEMIKLLIFDLVQNEGAEIGPTGAKELAAAHLNVIRGQAISTERRRKLEADFKTEAGKAIDKVAAAAGLSTDTVSTIRASILGIKAPSAAAP